MKKWFCLLMMITAALPMAGAQENAKCFEYVWFCDEDYIEVVQDGKWGLMNFNGEMLIPCEWESMYEPWCGYVPVMQGGLWGMIDNQGKLISECRWEAAGALWRYPFADGSLMPVVMDDLCGFVNLQGELVIPCVYDKEQLLGDGWDTPGYAIRGDRVAIRQDGVLSIFASDGTQVY